MGNDIALQLEWEYEDMLKRPKPPKETKEEAMFRLDRLLAIHFGDDDKKKRQFLYSHFTTIDIVGMADLLDRQPA